MADGSRPQLWRNSGTRSPVSNEEKTLTTHHLGVRRREDYPQSQPYLWLLKIKITQNYSLPREISCGLSLLIWWKPCGLFGTIWKCLYSHLHELWSSSSYFTNMWPFQINQIVNIWRSCYTRVSPRPTEEESVCSFPITEMKKLLNCEALNWLQMIPLLWSHLLYTLTLIDRSKT
jgi:hypothetical protein